MYKELLTSLHGDTFVISLNRSSKLNAFTKTMQDELIKVFDYTDQNDDIKSVVITGEGRAFCAGADLVEGPNTFNYAEEGNKLSNDGHRDGGGLVTLRIFRSKKPVIGAINGDAVGVGATMTLPMDIRLAWNRQFGFVFSRRCGTRSVLKLVSSKDSRYFKSFGLVLHGKSFLALRKHFKTD